MRAAKLLLTFPTLLALVVVANPSQSPAAAGPFPTTPIGFTGGTLVRLDGINSDATTLAVAVEPAGDPLNWLRWIDFPSQDVANMPIRPAPAPSDGTFAWSFVEDTTRVVRYDRTTMQRHEYPAAIPGGQWFAIATLGSDDGNVMAVQASNPGLGRVDTFLFAVDGANLAPGDRGISIGNDQTRPIDVSPEGIFVTHAEYATGGQDIRWVRWNRSTGERTVVERPSAHDPTAGAWTASVDLGWVAYWNAGQLHRTNVSSGATETLATSEVPMSYRLARGGRIVYQVEQTVEGVSQPGDLYLWNVGEAPTVITSEVPERFDGAPIDETWQLSIEGERLVYTSYVEGWQRRLFVTELPAQQLADLYPTPEAPPTPEPTGAVPPSGVRCASAEGAAPGDYVAVNVTPVGASGAGFGRIHSSDEPAGGTSNVNFGVGTVDPNVAFARVGGDGRICYTNSQHSTVDVIIDQLVTGSAEAFTPPTPEGATRLMDTRVGHGATTFAAGGTACVQAVGAAPGDYVAVNITPINAAGPGFGTIHSSDEAAGGTSNVNFRMGTTDPNVAFAKVGTDGAICYTNSPHSSVDVIIDQLVTGDADAFAAPTATGAARLMDTRGGVGATTFAPSASACVAAAGADPGAFVAVNVTPINATGAGFGTIHSSDESAGATSNVNFNLGTTDPNVAFAKVGVDGRICYTNSRHSSVDVIIDQLVTGSGGAFHPPTAIGAARLLDTRE